MSVTQIPANTSPAVDRGVDAEIVPLPVKEPQRMKAYRAYRGPARVYSGADADLKRARQDMRQHPESYIHPLNVGAVLHCQGDLPGALQMFRRSIRLRDTAAARGWVGTTLEALDDTVGAIINYRRAVALDPRHELLDIHRRLTWLVARHEKSMSMKGKAK